MSILHEIFLDTLIPRLRVKGKAWYIRVTEEELKQAIEAVGELHKAHNENAAEPTLPGECETCGRETDGLKPLCDECEGNG